MRFKRLALVLLAVAADVTLLGVASHSQENSGAPKTVTLLRRVKTPDADNYTRAAFSFKYGTNGDDGLTATRNNWDVLFGNSTIPDAFDVTTVTDDRSRIADLGELDWSQTFELPALKAYETPTRERSVPAVVGHIYLVHSKDTDSDHYALFRVEKLLPGDSVVITWKLLSDNRPAK
jgi:hypothetical protein